MDRDVFENFDLPRGGLDFHDSQIKHVAKGYGTGNAIRFIRRSQHWRVDDYRLEQPWRHAFGQGFRMPMGLGRNTAKWQGIFRHPDNPRQPVHKFNVFRRNLEVLGRNTPDPGCHSPGTFKNGINNDGREPVGVISGGQRPRTRQGVGFGHDIDLVGTQAQTIGHDLGGDSLMPLSSRGGNRSDGDTAGRVKRYRRRAQTT